MGRSGKSKKRTLDELPSNSGGSPPKRPRTVLDELPSKSGGSPPKRSGTVSSPRDPSSPPSSDSAYSTATASTEEGSQNTESDSGNNLQDDVKQQKPEKSDTTETEEDEGPDTTETEEDEGRSADEYNAEIQSAFARADTDNEENSVDSEDEDREGNKQLQDLFRCKEGHSLEKFHDEMIIYDSSAHVIEDPSSPFTGEHDEVDRKFESFLSEYPGGANDDAYLPFRQDANQVTIALSLEEIRDLDDSKSFWATAQHIDTYLYCRLKLFPNEIKERINQCSAYMISLNMKNLGDWNDQAPLKIMEKALEIEMKEVDFNIVPLLYRRHWTLAIVCGLGQQRDAHLPGVPFGLPCVLHFNSLELATMTLAHTYGIARAVAKKAHIETHQVEWHELPCPRQKNTKDCGFYTMRFAVDFVKNISSSNPLSVVDLFSLLQISSRYFINDNEKNDEISNVAKKARQQLKGFIGSIHPGERHWMTEFSEGRPCAIDTIPYCIPAKILEVSGNECKVKMTNYMRAEYVPLNYVKQYWRDIYDAYYSSN